LIRKCLESAVSTLKTKGQHMNLGDSQVRDMIDSMIRKYNHYPQPIDIAIEFSLDDLGYQKVQDFYKRDNEGLND
jgi:hypothetical protein